jgi:transcriptional regulator with XRE-family HTH domain
MRRDARLTQAQLAAKVGTTQSAIARLEAGRVSPSVRTLKRVYEALGRELRLLAMPAQAAYAPSGSRGSLQLAEASGVRYDAAHHEADIDLTQIRAARRLTVPERLDQVSAGARGIDDLMRALGR